MNKQLLCTLGLLASTLIAQAQTFKFDFSSEEKAQADFVKVTPQTIFSNDKGYGYDVNTSWDGKSKKPFFFSVNVPDGNYKVTITLGNKDNAGVTTVRGESRRLFYEQIPTKKGEFKTETFTINKRNAIISGNNKVKLKSRELGKFDWDDKLTFEFNGAAPQIKSMIIERDNSVPTVFLCGNSTVVDQQAEPYASWGQMIPRFFSDKVSVANYAESGLSANTFIGGNRLEKIKTQMKKGDYLFVEFGHNDQKQKGPGKGAFYSFAYYIKIYIDEARAKGAIPVIVTPTRRRRFDKDGKTILDTHGDFPKALHEIAARENVPVIDLQTMTKIMVEAYGEEESKHIYMYCPANTYPNQTREMKDNSHFGVFGAYEIAKCVAEGIKEAKLSIASGLRSDFKGFNPAKPDSFKDFHWDLCPFTASEKPAGS